MNWKDIVSNVGGIAASVAPLLGGPVGLAMSIGSQIAGALGTANTPQAVVEELKNNPEAALKLQQWAHDEKQQIRQSHIELQKIDLAQYQADLADRQHARTTNKDHWMPATLTIMLFVLFSAVLWALFYGPEITDNRDLIVYLVGNLFALLASSVAYWVSSTKGSRDKDKLVNLIQQNSKGA
ncbi:MAG: hypothetical protein HRT53_20650 [Colwellia sp.]|nr:hypothetical protein [Colwellia sp.]